MIKAIVLGLGYFSSRRRKRKAKQSIVEMSESRGSASKKQRDRGCRVDKRETHGQGGRGEGLAGKATW